MNNLTHFVRHLRLESLALAILMVVLTHATSASLWLLPATFLLFDIGMIGYAINPRIGAIVYNISHNLTTPTLCVAMGVYVGIEWLSVFGYCWIFHIAVDRTLGYGLKQKHSFHETHLGIIGKKHK